MRKKRIRLCIISLYSYPLFNPDCESPFGGSEVRVSLIAKELAKRADFDVNLIVFDHGQPPVEKREGVTLYAWPGKPCPLKTTLPVPPTEAPAPAQETETQLAAQEIEPPLLVAPDNEASAPPPQTNAAAQQSEAQLIEKPRAREDVVDFSAAPRQSQAVPQATWEIEPPPVLAFQGLPGSAVLPKRQLFADSFARTSSCQLLGDTEPHSLQPDAPPTTPTLSWASVTQSYRELAFLTFLRWIAQRLHRAFFWRLVNVWLFVYKILLSIHSMFRRSRQRVAAALRWRGQRITRALHWRWEKARQALRRRVEKVTTALRWRTRKVFGALRWNAPKVADGLVWCGEKIRAPLRRRAKKVAKPLRQLGQKVMAPWYWCVEQTEKTKEELKHWYYTLGWVGPRLVEKKDVAIYDEIGADIYMMPGNSIMTAELALYCQKRGKKYVFLAGSDGDYHPGYKENPEAIGIYGLPGYLMKFSIENASFHVVQNERQAELLAEQYQREATVIRNPLDLQHKYPKDVASRTILWIGKSDWIKRPEIILQLAQEFQDCQFKIVMTLSNPEIHQRSNELAQQLPNVTMLNYVPFQEIEEQFAGAGLFVNTSVFEGFPNAFIQAVKYGLPIVSYQVDPGQMLTKYQCGYAVNSDEQAFREKIRLLLNDPVLYAETSARCLHYAREYHDKDKVIAQYEAVLKSVSARKQRAKK